MESDQQQSTTKQTSITRLKLPLQPTASQAESDKFEKERAEELARNLKRYGVVNEGELGEFIGEVVCKVFAEKSEITFKMREGVDLFSGEQITRIQKEIRQVYQDQRNALADREYDGRKQLEEVNKQVEEVK